MPLGVLPLGTLNHFAKDLNIPLALTEAAGVIAANHRAAVDIGQVNDRFFINNSSLGMYPHAVLVRDAQRKSNGPWKWAAMTRAAIKVFRRFPMVQVRLTSQNTSASRKTPMVFVGNNRYQLDGLRVGTRERVDRGELCLHVANTQTRWGMLKLALRAAVSRLQEARDFESHCLSEFWIETRRHRLHVALDGEVVKLPPPLHYRVWPKALWVCVPPERIG
jgi:diacylglycerol kinase family enzyme